MIFLILILLLGLACAGLAYWVDARGETKLRGNLVIVLWLIVCACAVVLMASALVLLAAWSGSLFGMTGALR